MLYFDYIFLLFFAIVAVQFQVFDGSLASNALEPVLINEDENFNMFQSFDTSDVDLNIGLLNNERDNSMLFSNSLNDACFLSPADGKARRRRSELCFSKDTILDPSKSSPESLEKPGEYEQTVYSQGGFRSNISFLVCSSDLSENNRPVTTTSYTLYDSTRGSQIQVFPRLEVSIAARPPFSLGCELIPPSIGIEWWIRFSM